MTLGAKERAVSAVLAMIGSGYDRDSMIRFEVHLRHKCTPTRWCPRYGVLIEPRDMGYRHIQYTVRMIRRWGYHAKLYRELQCLGALSPMMGDGAYNAVESEARCYERMTVDQFLLQEVPVYRPLWTEHRIRAMG